MDKTCIIFGRSPFINHIADLIPQLSKKYFTIGINKFCESHKVDLAIACDPYCYDVKDTPIIFNALHYDSFKHAKNKLPHLMHVGMDFQETKGNLTICVHSASVAMNWAWQNGFENVILAGIDLESGTPHFDAENYIFSMPKSFIKDAIIQIEEYATKHINVYQANPNSKMKIPKINLEELL